MRWYWQVIYWIGRRFSSGPDYRADFESVASSWQRLSERLEAQLTHTNARLDGLVNAEKVMMVSITELRRDVKECNEKHAECQKRADAQQVEMEELRRIVERRKRK